MIIAPYFGCNYFFINHISIYVKSIIMRNKDTKQLLFENMEKLNPDFKSTLNEEAQRWNYSWGNGWNAVINNAFGDRFTWRVWEENEAIPPIFSSDWADLKTFKDAEEDMFSAIMDRIGHTPKSQSKLQELAPQPTQPVAGQPVAPKQPSDVQTLNRANQSASMVQSASKRINTATEFPEAFRIWFTQLGYKPDNPAINIMKVKTEIDKVMRSMGYK